MTTDATAERTPPTAGPARLLIDIRELAALLTRSVPALERDEAAVADRRVFG